MLGSECSATRSAGKDECERDTTVNVRARLLYYRPPSGFWHHAPQERRGSDYGSWRIALSKIVIVDLILRRSDREWWLRAITD
jgi:hypothetical protein